MRVTFRKLALGQCYWEAVRAKRARVPGCQMGGYVRPGALPHDLAQFVVEAGLGLRYGFWGLVADGATFRSMDKRQTREGRAIIRAHRDELNTAEALVNAELETLESGGPSMVKVEFDRIATQWAALPEGGTLEMVWSTPIPHRRRPSTSTSYLI
jgi:hypothetical protein